METKDKGNTCLTNKTYVVMKKLVLTMAVALMALCASANNYVANDAAIDALVENSVEMVMTAETAPATAPAAVHVAGKNPVIAAVLGWCTGWCGLHRYYLGTAPWMVLPYLLTGGGFGVVYVVDAVLLTVDALENTINPQYLGNERIIMWADLF